MHAFARQLSAEEIAAVSTYLSGFSSGDLLAPAPLARDDALAIQTATAICSTCHRQTLAGAARADVPNLTLQSPEYIRWQLGLL